MAGKGDKRRPCMVSRTEYELRYDYAYGYITEEEFNGKLKELKDVSGNSKDNAD